MGCPDGGGSSGPYNVSVYTNGSPSVTLARLASSTSAKSFTLTETTEVTWRFRVYAEKSIGATTFYPMICTEAAWAASNKYQPYRPSYDTLISKIAALEAIVPTPEAADNGKALIASNDGTAAWTTLT